MNKQVTSVADTTPPLAPTRETDTAVAVVVTHLIETAIEDMTKT